MGCKVEEAARALSKAFLLLHFHLTRFSPARSFLASHFCTDWLSRVGLGYQVGSTTNHLLLLPTRHTDRLKYDAGRIDREDFYTNIGVCRFNALVMLNVSFVCYSETDLPMTTNDLSQRLTQLIAPLSIAFMHRCFIPFVLKRTSGLQLDFNSPCCTPQGATKNTYHYQCPLHQSKGQLLDGQTQTNLKRPFLA